MKNNTTTDQALLNEYQEKLLIEFAHDYYVSDLGWWDEESTAYTNVLRDSLDRIAGVPEESVDGVFDRAIENGLIYLTEAGGTRLTSKGREHTLEVLIVGIATLGERKSIYELKGFIKKNGPHVAGSTLADLYKRGEINSDEYNTGFAMLIDILGDIREAA